MQFRPSAAPNRPVSVAQHPNQSYGVAVCCVVCCCRIASGAFRHDTSTRYRRPRRVAACCTMYVCTLDVVCCTLPHCCTQVRVPSRVAASDESGDHCRSSAVAAVAFEPKPRVSASDPDQLPAAQHTLPSTALITAHTPPLRCHKHVRAHARVRQSYTCPGRHRPGASTSLAVVSPPPVSPSTLPPLRPTVCSLLQARSIVREFASEFEAGECWVRWSMLAHGSIGPAVAAPSARVVVRR